MLYIRRYIIIVITILYIVASYGAFAQDIIVPCPKNIVDDASKSPVDFHYAPRENNKYCDGLVFTPNSGSLALVSLTEGDVTIPSDPNVLLSLSLPNGPYKGVKVVGQRLELGQSYRFDSVMEAGKPIVLSHTAPMFALGVNSGNFGIVGTDTSDGVVRVPVFVGTQPSMPADLQITVRTPSPLVRIVFDFLDPVTQAPDPGLPRIIRNQINGGQPIKISISSGKFDRKVLLKAVAVSPAGDPLGLLETIMLPARP